MAKRINKNLVTSEEVVNEPLNEEMNIEHVNDNRENRRPWTAAELIQHKLELYSKYIQSTKDMVKTWQTPRRCRMCGKPKFTVGRIEYNDTQKSGVVLHKLFNDICSDCLTLCNVKFVNERDMKDLVRTMLRGIGYELFTVEGQAKCIYCGCVNGNHYYAQATDENVMLSFYVCEACK